MPPCSVLTYQTPAGNAPVDEYITGLEGTAATKAAALVKLLEALPKNRAVLLDGMTKKRDDIPDATMKRLRALQAAVNAELKRPKKGR